MKIIKKKNINGFSLMELLVYIAILALSVGLLTSILMLATQSQNRESAASEVNSQLNFVIQTIQRLVRESSNIETAGGVATTTLTLRMKDSNKDPVAVKLEDGVIKMREKTTGSYTDLTNSRVIVDDLQFKKLSQYPGHDIVSINLTMRYNTNNPKLSVSRTLQSAIARVTAATFDDNLIPGSSNLYDLGTSGSAWKNAYFSGNVGIGTTGPEGKLSVVGNSADGVVLQVKQDGTGDPVIYFSLGSATPYSIGLDNSNGDALTFSRHYQVGTNTTMVMDNNGNVGIGTTNPLSKLAVSGLPTSVPDGSGTAGMLCITNDGNIWIDVSPATPCS